MQSPGSLRTKPKPGRASRREWFRGLLINTLAAALWPVLFSLRCFGAENPAALEVEYKVKAGYLFNFLKFIEWPAQALPAPDSPYVIAVLDSGETLPVLQAVLEGKRIEGHTVHVKAVTIEQAPNGHHVLFVTRAAGQTAETIKSRLAGAPVLTVGETEEFAERGGMIGFVREEDRIRIALNFENAAAAGLMVSSKLSIVAKVVRNKRAK